MTALPVCSDVNNDITRARSGLRSAVFEKPLLSSYQCVCVSANERACVCARVCVCVCVCEKAGRQQTEGINSGPRQPERPPDKLKPVSVLSDGRFTYYGQDSGPGLLPHAVIPLIHTSKYNPH